MDLDFEIRHIFNLMIRHCPMTLVDVTVQKSEVVFDAFRVLCLGSLGVANVAEVK